MRYRIEARSGYKRPFDEFVKTDVVALYSLDELGERYYLFSALRCDFLHLNLSPKSPITAEPGHLIS